MHAVHLSSLLQASAPYSCASELLQNPASKLNLSNCVEIYAVSNYYVPLTSVPAVSTVAAQFV